MKRGRTNRGTQVAQEKIMAQGATGNEPTAPQPSVAEPTQAQQQLIINAQYIKDLSFENPRAPASLRQQAGQPAVEINVDVKAQGLGPENYEVVLTIKASAKAQDETLFIIELAYGAIVTVRHVPQELVSPILLVETPRLMFPFARNIVAETTRDGGFPPLMINPIDFGELLRRNAAAPAAGDQAAGSATA
jgi:preprotein translocase subunit SecB